MNNKYIYIYINIYIYNTQTKLTQKLYLNRQYNHIPHYHYTSGEVSKVITCIGFDDGWNGFGGTNWGYFRDVNVNRVVDTRARGHSSQFSGKSRLEFNALNNAYLNYRSFAVSLWYKRARGTNVSESDGGGGGG